MNNQQELDVGGVVVEEPVPEGPCTAEVAWVGLCEGAPTFVLHTSDGESIRQSLKHVGKSVKRALGVDGTMSGRELLDSTFTVHVNGRHVEYLDGEVGGESDDVCVYEDGRCYREDDTFCREC